MNPKGHTPTLVAAHPGNRNALKSGVHSPRLIETRAAELREELRGSMELDATGQIVLSEVVRLSALIEAIDRDLDERGITDRQGKERYLLQRRERYSRRLSDASDQLVEAHLRATNRGVGKDEEIRGEPSDYVRQLQYIALGRDPEARTQDRLAALKLLVAMGHRGATSSYEPRKPKVPFPDDEEFQAEVARLEKRHEAAKKRGYLARLEQDVSAAELGY